MVFVLECIALVMIRRIKIWDLLNITRNDVSLKTVFKIFFNCSILANFGEPHSTLLKTKKQ